MPLVRRMRVLGFGVENLKFPFGPCTIQLSGAAASAPRSGVSRAATARTRGIAVVQGNGDRHDVALSEICSEIGGLGQG
jgi:hypothetical protein